MRMINLVDVDRGRYTICICISLTYPCMHANIQMSIIRPVDILAFQISIGSNNNMILFKFSGQYYYV